MARVLDPNAVHQSIGLKRDERARPWDRPADLRIEEDCYNQVSIVFMLGDGKITRMQDFPLRQDALDAAHASPDWRYLG